jgi:hypothetical protein
MSLDETPRMKKFAMLLITYSCMGPVLRPQASAHAEVHEGDTN